jgi:hypothetical protein
MSPWMQDIIVWLIAAGALGFVIWQSVTALGGGKSRIGGCGSCKGCGTRTEQPEPKPSGVQRTVFLPAEFLGRKR